MRQEDLPLIQFLSVYMQVEIYQVMKLDLRCFGASCLRWEHTGGVSVMELVALQKWVRQLTTVGCDCMKLVRKSPS